MQTTNILIVDDSLVDRMSLRRALTKSGAEDLHLMEAADAASALEIMSQARVDAVFLDINMPGENGFYVLRQLREAAQNTWPLVFMYSSSNHPDDVAEAYHGLATAFLCKPDDTATIRQMASSCITMIRHAEPRSALL